MFWTVTFVVLASLATILLLLAVAAHAQSTINRTEREWDEIKRRSGLK
jgi:hypothetical protein